MRKRGLPKSFTCGCGVESAPFPAYVFAHWDEPLMYKCESCGRRHTLLQGHAIERYPANPKPDPQNAAEVARYEEVEAARDRADAKLGQRRR